MSTTQPIHPLILTLLRARHDPSSRVKVEKTIATQPPDWDALIEQANHDRVTPLVYMVLKEMDRVPAGTLERLAGIYYQNLRQNMLRFNELEKLLCRFNQENIQVILLKGSALAESVYGNVGLRPMTDIDLFVHSDDLDRAAAICYETGFQKAAEETHPGDILAYSHHLGFSKPGGMCDHLELHWVLLNPSYNKDLSSDWLWETAAQVKVGKANAWILGPEAQIIHLCAHLCLHHAGEGLLWRNDVAEVIWVYQSQINWQRVIDKAAADKVLLPLQWLIPRVVRNLDAPVSDEALERLSRMKPDRKDERLFRRLMALNRSSAERTLDGLIGPGSLGHKLIQLLHGVFPTPTYMRARYNIRHPLLVPFYYPYRLWLGLTRRW